MAVAVKLHTGPHRKGLVLGTNLRLTRNNCEAGTLARPRLKKYRDGEKAKDQRFETQGAAN
eukprot:1159531-Pelagomonas_calceolata.AAC.7